MDALSVLLPKNAVPAPTIPATAVTPRMLTCSAVTKQHHYWSSERSCKPIKDTLMPWKLDVVLREKSLPIAFGPQPNFSWKDVISFVELSLTPYSKSTDTGTVHNNVMHKAYAIFASQPGRRYLFALSITNQEFHAHMFDRSGVIHSHPYNIHWSPCVLLCMLGLLAFGNPDHVGCDPTLVYFSPSSSQFTSPGTIQAGPFIRKMGRCWYDQTNLTNINQHDING